MIIHGILFAAPGFQILYYLVKHTIFVQLHYKYNVIRNVILLEHEIK